MPDTSSLLRYYVLKLPDAPALFSVPLAGVRRRDAEALVYDVRVRQDAFLRHYSFYDRCRRNFP